MTDNRNANRNGRQENGDGPSVNDHTPSETTAMTPSDEEIVQEASDAAESVIFSAYKQSAVRDFDVTVTFEEGILDIDVYLNAPTDGDPDRVADDAALAARRAVDRLFEES